MKKIILSISALILAAASLAAQNVTLEKPSRKAGSSFAIVIDNATYEHAKSQVYDYRAALQEDGLATWILRGDWQTPDEVRAQLVKLDKKARNLEGIVLVGDIPVVMVRNAQHMTTAFKMDEEAFPRTESSVGSDRFYDDLHLRFKYLDKDEDFFYYKLDENGPQTLSPTYYSARIKCPQTLGVDKYDAIAAFLSKAADAHRHPQDLDNIVTFAGSGYNSDCLITWTDEDITLRENFPGVKDDSNCLKQLNFRMDTYMKYRLFDELQRPEVDAMFFNEHGSIDKQHISDPPAPKEMADYVAEYKWGYGWIYSYIDHQLAKDHDTTAVINAAKEKFHLTDKFFEDYLSPDAREALAAREREQRAQTIISLEDLKTLETQPRFVMFNACYNGSFHRPGSISGYYIFGPGRTVATQGNTVNVLQDRWTYEAIGLLSLGCRIGEYNRMVATLEGHVIGDPTFHFNAVDGECFRGEIARHRGDARFWRQCLDSRHAAVQSVALRMLKDLGAITSDEILQKMKDCAFATVRMECLKLLSTMDTDHFVEAVKLGLRDNYEIVRRNAATMSGKCGDPRLCEAVMDVYLNRPEEQRVHYALGVSIPTLPSDALIAAVQSAKGSLTYLDPESVAESAVKHIEGTREDKQSLLKTLQSDKASLKAKVAGIRRTRNANYHEYIPEFLAYVADASNDDALRAKMAEALGWYTMSYRKAEIIAGCQRILSETTLSPELREELIQTINRLR